jgi:hypothetical protein
MQKKMIRSKALHFLVAGSIMISALNLEAQEHSGFRKHTLTTDFISEGVAVGDVNRDKKMDVIAGAYWFEAPGWKRHELAPGKVFDGAKEYSNSFLNFSMDVNQDGWIDLIWIDFPGKAAHWYENPKNKPGHWRKHVIADSVSVGNESPAFVDVNNDGRPDIICADSKAKQMVWLKAPKKKGNTTWQRFAISKTDAPGTNIFSHGIGYGDVNKDGRADVVIREGWWEAPRNREQPDWTFHPAALGEDCSQMHVLDVNADGTNDVVSCAAHRRGIWWHEQQVNADGNATWKTHLIIDSITQTHSSTFADLDKDGNPDLITGKRFFAHNDTNNDPGTYDPPYILWFRFTPGKAPYWTPNIIDNNSGVGLNIVARDMNKDKTIDIVISNKKGVYYFENVKKK